MAFNFSPKAVIDSSLIAYLDAGNVKSYYSGKSNWEDLTINNNTVVASGNTYFDSQNNGSFVFDGSSDYMFLNSPTNLPSGTCTILCWCNPDASQISIQDYIGLVSWGTRTNATPSNAILLAVNNAASPSVYVSSAYWFNDYSPSNLLLDNGSWNMIGIVARQGAILNNTTLICGNSLGLNFSTGTSAAYTRTLNFTNINLRVGCTDSNGGRAFKGKIASVMIYNRELTQLEIAQNYNATKSRFGL